MKRWIFFSSFLFPYFLFGHCQIPCGIYHDDLVFDQMAEMIETMEKSVQELQKNPFSNAEERQQFIRWVENKSSQADHFAEKVSAYFLQQRIPMNAGKEKLIVQAHALLVLAMKVKQQVDPKTVEALKSEYLLFKKTYQ